MQTILFTIGTVTTQSSVDWNKNKNWIKIGYGDPNNTGSDDLYVISVGEGFTDEYGISEYQFPSDWYYTYLFYPTAYRQPMTFTTYQGNIEPCAYQNGNISYYYFTKNNQDEWVLDFHQQSVR